MNGERCSGTRGANSECTVKRAAAITVASHYVSGRCPSAMRCINRLIKSFIRRSYTNHPLLLFPLLFSCDMDLRYGLLGESMTNAILGKTFFAHFCAGETAEQVGRRKTVLVPRFFGSNRRVRSCFGFCFGRCRTTRFLKVK